MMIVANDKRKTDLKNKIRTLEWDLKRNQIHFAKKRKLDAYKKELEDLENGNNVQKAE